MSLSSPIVPPDKINVSLVALRLARILDRLPAGRHTITFNKSEIAAEAWKVSIVGYDEHGNPTHQQYAITKTYSPE